MAEQVYTPRLKQQYRNVIRGDLKNEFTYKNVMQIPRLEKVVLNIGVGEAVGDSKKVKSAANDLGLIAGQRPVITKARKSIAAFKLREGMPIGVKVTLRKNRMYEFIDRLVNIALPRETIRATRSTGFSSICSRQTRWQRVSMHRICLKERSFAN